jgi:cyclomaltodextrinase
MTDWPKSSTFYHIYPLGLCGAPQYNHGESTAGNRLNVMFSWLDAIQELGCDAIYLGPIFESAWHGYDTTDYYHVDSRLGTNDDLKAFSAELHRRGMRLVLDGVFNHVGRGFWAFRDLQEHGQISAYREWFAGVDFSRHSPKGDAFDYGTWEGHYSLPKLNLHNPDVRRHLFDAVRMWMREFKIDGLRLDAADCVEPFFWKELHQVTKGENPEFWLMGEIIHGDYRIWANDEMFDSVTNYCAYKALWSSLNDANYHEIAYTLDQQSDRQQGTLKHLHLYNFVDNHDVSRISSVIKDQTLLYPLYLMLFTMPGIPSIYYGSEFGVTARKEDGDEGLRQAYGISSLMQGNLSLRQAIQNFSAIRKRSKALMFGDYRKLIVQNQQIAYARSWGGEMIVIVINSSDQSVEMKIPLHSISSSQAVDILKSR